MKVPFDLAKDFPASVTVLAYSPHMLAVYPGRRHKTAAELIAYAKANPGKLNNAMSGIGSPPTWPVRASRSSRVSTGPTSRSRVAPRRSSR